MRYGHGFNPLGAPTAEELERLRAALVAAGRSLDEIELVGGIVGRFEGADDVADLDEALATLPAKVAAGYRTICFKPSHFTDDARAIPALARRVVDAVAAAAE